MPKLIVANVDSLAMCGSPRDEEDYRFSTVAAERLLVMASEEDLIVLPTLPSADFLSYLNALLGRHLSQDNVIVPRGGRQEMLIWSHEALNDGDVADQVRSRVGDVRGWGLVAFFLDRPTLALADSLELRIPRTAGFLRSGGAESLNSKVAFREIAEKAGVPIAPGRTVASPAQLAEALLSLIGETGHVIVKQDINLGGVGNTVVTLSSVSDFAGSRTTVHLRSPGDASAAAANLWPHLTAGANTRAVVESYYPDSRPLCCEFLVHGAGKVPELLNFGEMIMDPVYVGLELHSGQLGEVDTATMVTYCTQLARSAGDRGFVGHLNVDSLLTASGRVLVNEINGRMGGTTHIDTLCRSLLGERYPRTHTLLARSRVPVRSFERAIKALESGGLSFDRDRAEGSIVVADGVSATGTVEYVVLAGDLRRARRIEHRTRAALSALN